MSIGLMVAIEVSILAVIGVAVALKNTSNKRRVAQIRVPVDNPRRKIGQNRS